MRRLLLGAVVVAAGLVLLRTDAASRLVHGLAGPFARMRHQQVAYINDPPPWLNVAPPALQPGEILLPLADLEEFDFLSRAAILDRRVAAIERVPTLAPRGYRPAPAIFGEIEDGLPWWGVLGTAYFGAGAHSIDGPSKDSRFILNPYLLIMTDEAWFWRDPRPGTAPAWGRPVMIEPLWAVWNADQRLLRMRLLAGPYLKFLDAKSAGWWIDLYTHNARDFGYQFMHVAGTAGAHAQVDRIHPLNELIRRNHSCGFWGGCNNTAPYAPDKLVHIHTLPTTLTIKLWREQPTSEHGEPDWRVDMELVE